MNPLQALYSLGLNIDKKFTTSHELPHPVISVGNISVGGRAKTPMVIDLCLELKKHGYIPVVLTRGYARKSKEDVWLLPETLRELQRISADESGDEAVEIFLKAEVAVLVSADRVTQARKYSQQFKNSKNIFVLDDGMQHWKLKRNFDLALVSDADFEDSLLPTGRLRESVGALSRVDLVLKLEEDLKKEISIQAKDKLAPGAVAVTTRAGSQTKYADSLKKYLAFDVTLLSLQDHLHKEALLSEIALVPVNTKQLILGLKEAVKLFSPQTLRNNKKFPLVLDIQGRSFEVFLVELSLNYDRQKLWNAIQQKGFLS